jgi:hypothetical protein
MYIYIYTYMHINIYIYIYTYIFIYIYIGDPSRKRSSDSQIKGGKKMKKNDYNGQSEREIKESARKLVANMPTYKEHISSFIEAEDPENGIEVH